GGGGRDLLGIGAALARGLREIGPAHLRADRHPPAERARGDEPSPGGQSPVTHGVLSSPECTDDSTSGPGRPTKRRAAPFPHCAAASAENGAVHPTSAPWARTISSVTRLNSGK